ncbi:MAG: choice-of-anchor tandem repeat GloVer-containing protein [Bacteroidota bacterium]
MKTIIGILLLSISTHVVLSQNNTFRLWGTTGSESTHPDHGTIFSANADGTDYTVVRKFKQNADGALLYQAPIKASDGFLYGMTKDGGINQKGVIYRMNNDGTNYTKVFDFPDGEDGPHSRLTEGTDGKLYGVLNSSDPNDPNYFGIIFRIDKDGSNYSTVYHFNNDTYNPAGGLLMASDNYLYGATMIGGNNGGGVMYKVKTDGSDFTILRHLAYPEVIWEMSSSFVEGSDGMLYGVWISKGLFRMDKNGGNYQLLHEFTDAEGTQDGGFILTPGGKIYGLTVYGGANQSGTIYSINNDGTGYVKLHDFLYYTPVTTMALGSDGKLYGLTELKEIYSIETNGNNFTVIGMHPAFYATLSTPLLQEISPGKFLGVSPNTGASANGMIFTFDASGNFTIVKDFPAGGLTPNSELLLASDGRIYGQTLFGGSNGAGVLFRVEADGTGYTEIFSLPNTREKLNAWFPALVEYNDFLVGSDGHSVFRIKKDGTGFTYPGIVDYFTGLNGQDAGKPYGTLIVDGAYVYGVTRPGQYGVGGILYKLGIETGSIATLFDFTSHSSDLGTAPVDISKLGKDRFIIVTSRNGAEGNGSMLSIKNDGTDPKLLPDVNTDSFTNNLAPLLASDGRLYGSIGYGDYMWSMNADGTDYKTYGEPDVYTNGSGRVIEPKPGTLFLYRTEMFIKFDIATKENTDYYHEWGPSYTGVIAVNKTSQTITMDDIPVKMIGDEPFNITASSSLGLPITFIVDDESVATVDGDVVTIVGVGTTTIMAYQEGSNTVIEALTTRTLTVSKKAQSITFDPIESKVVSEGSLNLNATASSGLTVAYTTVSYNISISESQVTFLKAGRATVTASQLGNATYESAVDVERSFCINPPKPTISVNGTLLTSSSDTGNQWYLNGTLITTAIAKTFTASQDGTYTVKTTIGDCASVISDGSVYTGLTNESDLQITVYPNPATDEVFVKSESQPFVTIIDITGRVIESKSDHHIDVSSYAKGIYFARIEVNGKLIIRSFAKL